MGKIISDYCIDKIYNTLGVDRKSVNGKWGNRKLV